MTTQDKQRKLLALVCDEIYVTQNKLVVKFSEAFNLLSHVFSAIPTGSKTLENVPSPYKIFELSKDGSITARKDVTDTESTALLRLLDEVRTSLSMLLDTSREMETQ